MRSYSVILKGLESRVPKSSVAKRLHVLLSNYGVLYTIGPEFRTRSFTFLGHKNINNMSYLCMRDTGSVIVIYLQKALYFLHTHSTCTFQPGKVNVLSSAFPINK